VAKGFLDKQDRYIDIKDNSLILSAIEEIAKTNEVDSNFTDNDTLENIAKKLGVDVNDFLLIVNEKNSTAKEFLKAYPVLELDDKDEKSTPPWLQDREVLDLDVRESLSNGVDPFGMIMKTIANLNGKVLHIINTFETVPLYSVLGKQGFEHYSKEENGIWHIYFYKI